MQTIVIALGGNAIIKANQFGMIEEQFENTRQAMRRLIPLWEETHWNFLITHGNGPQVGNILIRVEASRDKAYEVPLGVAVAQTQGEMGYMIAQEFMDQFHEAGIDRQAVGVLTQVLVDPDDPSMLNPTKPVGPFYKDEDQVQKLLDRGVKVVEDSGRGWRRVVPSPIPLSVLEADAIKLLLDNNFVVVAGGGGGMPVYRDEHGNLEGVDGVVDKDLASAVLAAEVGAQTMIIITGVEKVSLNFGKEDEKPLTSMTVPQALQYLEAGHFPPGSMGPKIQAAVNFLKKGGTSVIITDIDHITKALDGKAGTHITMEWGITGASGRQFTVPDPDEE